MLANLFLWFSVLCFSFTNPDRRELRKREKKKKEGEKEKKWLTSLGYMILTLLPAVHSQLTGQLAA
jgi:hypothetical protein